MCGNKFKGPESLFSHSANFSVKVRTVLVISHARCWYLCFCPCFSPLAWSGRWTGVVMHWHCHAPIRTQPHLNQNAETVVWLEKLPIAAENNTDESCDGEPKTQTFSALKPTTISCKKLKHSKKPRGTVELGDNHLWVRNYLQPCFTYCTCDPLII